jgi:hypothetical protein
VHFGVNEASTLTFRVERRAGRRPWTTRKSFARRRPAGRGSAAFRTRGLRPGRYRVAVRAQDRAHNRSRRVVRRFRVLRHQ